MRRIPHWKRPAAGSLLALSMIFGSSTSTLMPVFAQEEAAVPRTGSLTFLAGEAGSLQGRQFAIYTVFQAIPSTDGTSVNYTFEPGCEKAVRKVVVRRMNKTPAGLSEYEVIDYIQTLKTQKEGTLESDTSRFRLFVEELRDELKASKASCQMLKIEQTQPDGSYTLSGLPFGWYLVDEIYTSGGQHRAASLCMVDTQTGQAQVTLKGDYPDLTKKIFEDDHGIGWNDIADVQIGQTIPYKFESRVPNIAAYDTYLFAIHDRMDPAITFDPASIKITLSDGTKTCVIPPKEYALLEAQPDETFRIVIEDLKAIVDREYGAGQYGQTILIEYEGRLNEQAIQKTGRPGFENTVWLEFSNDPDSDSTHSTGRTPEDTVVCFTYRLDGTKINDAKKELAGAKFRLLADKEGKQEILVQKSKDSYVVMDDDLLQKDPSLRDQAVVMESDEKGRFEIIGLDQGTYYLEEISAPDGYRRLKDPMELTITPTFTEQRNEYIAGQGATEMVLKDLQGDVKVTEFLNGALSTSGQVLNTDVENGRVDLEVINHTGLRLPLTGSNTVVLMLGAGGLLVVSGIWMKKRTKK